MRKRLAALSRYQYPLLAVLVLALLVTVAVYVYKPLQATRLALDAELADRRRDVAALQNLLSRRPQFEKRLQEIDVALTDLKQQLVQGRQQPSFLTYLEDSASQARVVVTTLNFENPQPVESDANQSGRAQGSGGTAGAASRITVLRYPVRLEVLGGYPGVVEFVGLIERVAPFVSVDDITIVTAATSPASDRPASLPDGWVHMDMRMSVLAEAEGTSEWARELSELAGDLGRSNPFERPPALQPTPGTEGSFPDVP